MEEIVPGLYRLRTPMHSPALPWVMPYAFRGEGGVSLFDSGYDMPKATQSLTEQLHELGYEPGDIRRLIVSHAHADHLGMAEWIKQQSPDCELVMLEREWQWFDETHNERDESMARQGEWLIKHGVPPAEIEEARADDERSQQEGDGNDAGEESSGDIARETQRRWWRAPRVEPDVTLRDGDVLEFDGWRLEAVWTPGHTPGHLCVYEPNHRLMFTGDHILSRITPNVSLGEEDEAIGRNPLGEFRDSLRKVAAYDTVIGLPAHEDTIADLPRRCEALIEHHDHRLVEVFNGIGGRTATAREVSARVTWNKPFEGFSIYKKRSALGETLSHLQLLADEGRVRRVDGDPVRWEQVRPD